MAHSHLNGSVNMPTAEDVFRNVVATLGDKIDKLPDGETGERGGWVAPIAGRLRASADLVEGQPSKNSYRSQPVFSIAPGKSYEDIEFPNLEFADYALESYEVFKRLRDEGVIRSGVRFQVSLPTVLAGVFPFIKAEERLDAEPAYKRRLKLEVGMILDAIPHEDLAIQWDLAVEMGVLEGRFPLWDDPFSEVLGRMVELGAWVPSDVLLGYHLCYGDSQEVPGEGEGRHWKEPQDTGLMVRLSNAICAGLERPVNWFSMPVPIDRDDDAYFEPLEQLDVDPETEIFLGLVHHQDGVEGTQRRIATAKRHLERFGVATECGMGRKPPELPPKLLDIQSKVVV